MNAPQKSPAPSGQRLQKILAAAGLGSRRECELIIQEGRVEIDRKTVLDLGVRVDPQTQEIRVDGSILPRPKRVYYALNKPPGVVCTNHDPDGRTRVIDLLPRDHRLFTVGRLDRASQGLILLTNDGELAHQLTHPKFGVAKTYAVRVAGHPEREALAKLRQGVYLSDGVARAESIHIKHKHARCTDLEIVLREGRNREIRRILAKIGHKVMKLKRIAVGGLRLGEMPLGAYRELTSKEIQQLERTTGQAAKPQRRKRSSNSGDRASAPGGRKKRGFPKTPLQQGRQGAVLAYDDEPAGAGSNEQKPPKPSRSLRRKFSAPGGGKKKPDSTKFKKRGRR